MPLIIYGLFLTTNISGLYLDNIYKTHVLTIIIVFVLSSSLKSKEQRKNMEKSNICLLRLKFSNLTLTNSVRLHFHYMY